MKISKFFFVAFTLVLFLLSACRHDEIIYPSQEELIIDFPSEDSEIGGFYLLNEGNMGSNKCTLDRFDYFTGVYHRNIYSEMNPDVAMELGDVGNAIGVYGSKLYIVVNCSHKVEVLDLKSGRRIGQVDIPNCRYLAFDGGNAYVSSYIGPVGEDPNCPRGAVFRIDTLSLGINGECPVGYQPEEMAVIDGKLYVANSGGYRPPEYDTTISVIDLASFREERKIEIAPNLHRLKKDSEGRLWVSSRGTSDGSYASSLYMLEPDRDGEMHLAGNFPEVEVSNMTVWGDSLYFFYARAGREAAYGIFDLRTLTLSDRSFIDTQTASDIKMPYLIDVHPETGDVFISDARNYVSSGELYCISPEGETKWHVRTGDIPAAICFTPR